MDKSTKEFYCVDAGSAGGFRELHGLEKFIYLLSSDPRPEVKKNVSNFLSEKKITKALYNLEGRFPFYITNRPTMSSFREPDLALFDTYFGLMKGSDEWKNGLEIQSIVECDTIELDNLIVEMKWPRIDFLKLDTQGTEADILKGAENLLRENKILIIKTEFSFLKMYKGQFDFSQLDQFLKENNFIPAEVITYNGIIDSSRKLNSRKIKFSEDARFWSGGDAIYVNSKLLEKDSDFTMRAAALLSKSGCLSFAFSILKTYLKYTDEQASNFLAKFLPAKSKLKKIVKNNLPASVIRGIKRISSGK